jgi:sporulation-control protein spo0M
MNQDWIKIYTSHDFYKSELVRQALIDNEIDAVIMNKQGFPYQIGEVEVYIRGIYFQQAIEVIIKNEL